MTCGASLDTRHKSTGKGRQLQTSSSRDKYTRQYPQKFLHLDAAEPRAKERDFSQGVYEPRKGLLQKEMPER